jgi:hypothetical protein
MHFPYAEPCERYYVAPKDLAKGDVPLSSISRRQQQTCRLDVFDQAWWMSCDESRLVFRNDEVKAKTGATRVHRTGPRL